MRFKVLFLLVFVTSSIFGQDKIVWKGDFDAVNNRVLLQADLAEGWHVYSMFIDEMSGPVATKIELKENDDVLHKGEVKEPEPIVAYDESFEAELQYFEKTVIFEQELKIKKSTTLEYIVTYMICNDVMCYPPVDDIVKISIEK